MSIVAICAAADLAGVNADLDAAGFGPGNFSEVVYDSSNQPTHAALHCWPQSDFQSALEADARVTIAKSEVGSTSERLQSLIDAQGLQWPDNTATEFPSAGTVNPGEIYWTGDVDRVFWRVIQQYDAATWPDPSAPGLLALVRRVRIPGQVTPWVQPIDQFDGYYLVNPFTGEPDRVTHNGSEWVVSQADAGAVNTFEPGVFGWTNLDPAPAIGEWASGVAYAVGDEVTYQGASYRCRQAHTSNAAWTPTAVLALWLPI